MNNTDTATRAAIDFHTVVLDTDDPAGLAEFYCALLGWQVEDSDDDWVTIGGGTAVHVAFQLALNHKPPTWPDNEVPQQYHLDLKVADLDSAAAYAESVGAKRVTNAGGADFIVFIDPSGHPFCLCR